MGRTRQKLDEAAYFLQKIQEHYFDALEDEGRPLIYYISAFVSAARSVPWIVRSEYGDSDGWKAWYDARSPATEDLPLLRSFTEARNRSEKVDPLRVGIRVFASPESERAAVNSDSAPGNPKLRRYRLTIRQVDAPSGNPRSMEAMIDSIKCNLPELGEEDLLRACTRYFELLGKLVDECEARFDITSV